METVYQMILKMQSNLTLIKKDTDGDGFDDKTEVTYGFSPVRPMGNLVIDENFVNTNKGKIFLQVQNHGEAWYVNPTDGKSIFSRQTN